MTTEEEEPLVNDSKSPEETKEDSWTKLRISIVLIILALYHFAMYYYAYSRNEWLQNKEQRELFPNETVSVDKVCGVINQSDPNYDKHAKVQQRAAKWTMFFDIGSKSICLFTSCIYVAYTDCFGRRFLFILSSLSLLINSAGIALVIFFDAHPIYLVVTEILYGLTGTSYGLRAVTYSYVADLTHPGTERSTALFLVKASDTLGQAIGSFSVGYFIESSGYFYPALTSASIHLLLLFVVIFAIPESLTKQMRISLPTFTSVIKRPFSFYTSSDFKYVRCRYFLLLISFAFTYMTITHRSTKETLYQLGLPFCWKPTQIAIFSLALSAGKNIVGLGAILQKCAHDVTISLLSAVTNAGSLVVEGLATSSLIMYLATVPAVLNDVAAPLIRSTMSAMTSEKQQGALFASVVFVESLCSLIGGITDNAVYAATLEVFNGFIFILLAGYCAVTVLLLSIFVYQTKGKNVSHFEIQ